MTPRELIMAVIRYGYCERAYGYHDAISDQQHDDFPKLNALLKAAADIDRHDLLRYIYDHIDSDGNVSKEFKSLADSWTERETQ